MSKNKTDDFLSKFANRVEKVGRDGIMGLIKNTGQPISSIKQKNDDTQIYGSLLRKNIKNEDNKNNIDFGNSSFNSKNNLFSNNIYNSPIRYNNMSNNNNYPNNKYSYSKIILPSINNIQAKKMNSNFNENNCLKNPLKNSNNTFNGINNFNDNNQDYFNSRSNVRSNSINIHYQNNKNNNYLFEYPNNNNISQRNIYSVANNRQNIVDYGYTPYTLKDYKKIDNDVKLGKLGPNIGTEEWKKKQKKMKKMSEYGNKVISEGKGCYVKMAESADEMHKKLQEMKMLNGKWNIINEYSRGLMLSSNRNSNERFKRNVNNKLMEEERLIDKQFEIDMEKEEEEEKLLQQKRNAVYQQRLNKMKNLLFN